MCGPSPVWAAGSPRSLVSPYKMSSCSLGRAGEDGGGGGERAPPGWRSGPPPHLSPPRVPCTLLVPPRASFTGPYPSREAHRGEGSGPSGTWASPEEGCGLQKDGQTDRWREGRTSQGGRGGSSRAPAPWPQPRGSVVLDGELVLSGLLDVLKQADFPLPHTLHLLEESISEKAHVAGTPATPARGQQRPRRAACPSAPLPLGSRAPLLLRAGHHSCTTEWQRPRGPRLCRHWGVAKDPGRWVCQGTERRPEGWGQGQGGPAGTCRERPHGAD